MASYPSIIEISRQVAPAYVLPYPGSCGKTLPAGFQVGVLEAPAIPSSVSHGYTPQSIVLTRSDPTKGTGRNWTKIKKSGEISFTPYSVGKLQTDNYVAATSHKAWRARRPWTSCSDTPIVYNLGKLELVESHFVKQFHIGSVELATWTNNNSSFRKQSEGFESDILDAISTTQQAAYAEALSTYDLLTELVEAQKTLEWMRDTVGSAADALRKLAHTDESTWRRARKMIPRDMLKSSDKAIRRLGSRWMEYRYAIMPLVYSIKDINELIGSRDSVYKTGRSNVKISFSVLPEDFLHSDVELYSVGSAEAKVSSVFKARYDRGALQRVLSQTTFNPFLTAWELVPYSFVVDWFLNVGDAISAATLIDSSSQSIGCTSVKRTLIHETHLRDFSRDSYSYTTTAPPNYPPVGYTTEHQRTVDVVLQRTVDESYRRFVYKQPKPSITFDPHLNWKRFLDGFVLSYQPIRKLLRSL